MEEMNEEIALKALLSCQNICTLLNEEKDLKEKISLLEQLIVKFNIIKVKELNLTHVPNWEEYTCHIIKSIIDPGLVHDFPDSEERDFDKKDFPYVATAAFKSFSCLKLVLLTINVQLKKLMIHEDVLNPILKLCASHHENFLWSDESTVLICRETLEILLMVSDCHDLMVLLCGGTEAYPGGMLRNILLCMRSSLTKETWMRNPSTCQIFKWLLLNVKHQHLSEFLDDVLPPTLVFVDHHAITSKVLGIKCLDHIIDNVPPDELKMYGRADVIFDVLDRLTYYNEPPVVEVLYPCLIKFLHGQERNPNNAFVRRNWNKYDGMYKKLLCNMDTEQRVVLRRTYSAYISKFVEKMGFSICKHLKHTLEVFLKYLEVHDGPEEISRKNILLALHSLIKVAWTRMPYHMLSVLKGLIFLVYDIERNCGTDVETVKQEILNLCSECMLLLKMTSPTKFKSITQGMTELQDLPAVGLLKSVIES